jgi:hypothetical protein
MKFTNFLVYTLFLNFVLLVCPNNLLAHPHHETEQFAMLGIDHILLGLLVILVSFVALGKIFK